MRTLIFIPNMKKLQKFNGEYSGQKLFPKKPENLEEISPRVNVLAKNAYFFPAPCPKISLFLPYFPATEITKIMKSGLTWREAPKFLNI